MYLGQILGPQRVLTAKMWKRMATWLLSTQSVADEGASFLELQDLVLLGDLALTPHKPIFATYSIPG